tara:strand:+ start:265 stop:702 length:438 start_codon:yes stop_codon:yes gene_type:complete
MQESTETLMQQCVEKIEAAYEFMLAYAAQGRKVEATSGAGPDGPSIRAFLESMVWGLEHIVEGYVERVESMSLATEVKQQCDNFAKLLSDDAASALTTVKMVLSVPSLSSQVIDNLNASTHLRCLLTDIFVIDEVLKIHQQSKSK